MRKGHKLKSNVNNLEDVKSRFSNTLTSALVNRFGKVPTANALANHFNFRAKGEAEISRETVRKWLAGETMPDMLNLIILIDWLKLDANQFMSLRPKPLPTEDDLVIDTIRELLRNMDDKARNIILITAWAFRETQALHTKKLDLPSLRRTLIRNLEL